jgi:UDP-N-acetyl-2-amino-2-deoxyglucuronate dehydrogenase
VNGGEGTGNGRFTNHQSRATNQPGALHNLDVDAKLGAVRFGLAGPGALSGAHVRALQALDGVAELTAVADIRTEAAQAVAEHAGCRAFGSLEEMLENSDIEAVSICTPPNVHADLAVKAMEAGKHAIIEKPADVNLDATDRIIAAARATGCKATVITQHRFDSSTLVLRKAVEEGRLGRLTRGAAQVRWWRPQEYFDAVPWRGSEAVSGGGALISQSIHTIDLLLWTMGAVEEVFAYQAILAHDRIEIEDTLAAILKFRSGAIGVVEASIATYPGLSARLEIAGDRGSAVVDGDSLTYFHAANPGEKTGMYGAFGDTDRSAAELDALTTADAARFAAAPIVGLGNQQAVRAHTDTGGTGMAPRTSKGGQEPGQLSSAHEEQIRDFAEAIREDRRPAVSLEDTRYVLEVIFAIHESARTGLPVGLEA